MFFAASECICIDEWSSHIAGWASTGMTAYPARGQLNGKMKIPSHCSRLRMSRGTGLAVPSRVSLLILHAQAESSAYSRVSLFPPLSATASIRTVYPHHTSYIIDHHTSSYIIDHHTSSTIIHHRPSYIIHYTSSYIIHHTSSIGSVPSLSGYAIAYR